MVNLVNSILWMFYGILGINNSSVYGPNILCILCVAINIVLKLYLDKNSNSPGARTTSINFTTDDMTNPVINNSFMKDKPVSDAKFSFIQGQGKRIKSIDRSAP